MSRGIRLFLFLLLVALPPLVLLGLLEALGKQLVNGLGQGTTLLLVGVVAAIWAGIITLFASGSLSDDVRALVDLAERGMAGAPNEVEAESSAHRRLAAVLDERNRQLGELAGRLRAAPIEQDAGVVARAVVDAARSVTDNQTWTLAVVRSDDADLIPGVYAGVNDPVTDLGELQRWAAVSGDDPTEPRLIEGPWGQFLVVPVAIGEGDSRARAVLLSPWEGRVVPTVADVNLLKLLGELGAAAIDHARLYAQLRARTEELNKLTRLQSDFLRGVTHDLQTPLTSIRALAAELEADPGTDAAARADLQTIAYQADRLRRMVGQLLVVSRLEAGALTPRQDVFRLEPIVERTWKALRAADRPFALRSSGPPFLVVADADRLEQVLWALLDNAVKYSPAGSEISVDVSAMPNGDRLTADVAISDQGPGMTPEVAAHAFEQFYRAGEARRDAPDGSGVGLYAARGLIEAMNGSIRITTAPGAGSRVAFTLPAEPIADPLDEAAAE